MQKIPILKVEEKKMVKTEKLETKKATTRKIRMRFHQKIVDLINY